MYPSTTLYICYSKLNAIGQDDHNSDDELLSFLDHIHVVICTSRYLNAFCHRVYLIRAHKIARRGINHHSGPEHTFLKFRQKCQISAYFNALELQYFVSQCFASL